MTWELLGSQGGPAFPSLSPCILARLKASQDEDAGPDDGGDAIHSQVNQAQATLHARRRRLAGLVHHLRTAVCAPARSMCTLKYFSGLSSLGLVTRRFTHQPLPVPIALPPAPHLLLYRAVEHAALCNIALQKAAKIPRCHGWRVTDGPADGGRGSALKGTSAGPRVDQARLARLRRWRRALVKVLLPRIFSITVCHLNVRPDRARGDAVTCLQAVGRSTRD
jgi:hypothetical protein